MFIYDLVEATASKIVVIYPGRFQPFHKGHAAVYNHLCEKYGSDNVYICTSNKVEPPRSPFNFQEKLAMMKLTGINANKVIEDAQPYRAEKFVAKFPADTTILIFAVSEKDMAEDPRFKFGVKKDGSPTYLQPLKDIKKCKPLSQHGYLATVPTFDFEVLGKPANSASQIRDQFAGADEDTQKKIVADLFGTFNSAIFKLMKNKLAAGINEGIKDHRPQYEEIIKQLRARTDLSPSVKEYLIAINDPNGKIFKAAYYSFPKGAAARDQAANSIAAKYNIDPQDLHDAEIQERARIINGWKVNEEVVDENGQPMSDAEWWRRAREAHKFHSAVQQRQNDKPKDSFVPDKNIFNKKNNIPDPLDENLEGNDMNDDNIGRMTFDLKDAWKTAIEKWWPLAGPSGPSETYFYSPAEPGGQLVAVWLTPSEYGKGWVKKPMVEDAIEEDSDDNADINSFREKVKQAGFAYERGSSSNPQFKLHLQRARDVLVNMREADLPKLGKYFDEYKQLRLAYAKQQSTPEGVVAEAVEQENDLLNPDPKIRALAKAVVQMKQQLATLTDEQPEVNLHDVANTVTEMHEHARQGRMLEVTQCLHKLQPFQEHLQEDISKALKVAKRNAG